MCLNTGTPKKNINFSFQTNGKLRALGVPILKHFRVFTVYDALVITVNIDKSGNCCGGVVSEMTLNTNKGQVLYKRLMMIDL